MSRFLIIGAGINGLTCAYRLLEAKHQVIIVSDRFPPFTTSNVAGALWEWPPAVCGFYDAKQSKDISLQKKWAEISYRKFYDLHKKELPTGVFLRKANFYFSSPVLANTEEAAKMNELKGIVLNFLHSESIVKKNEIADDKIVDAYQYLAPMVDTDTYLQWMVDHLTSKGAILRTQKIERNLSEEAHRLKSKNEVDLVINCTGLGAYDLCDKTVFAVKGGLLRLRNYDNSGNQILEAHCTSINSEDENEFNYIVPRGKDSLVIGGYAIPMRDHTEQSLLEEQFYSGLFARNCRFYPPLANFTIPLDPGGITGYRPYREDGIRLEKDREVDFLIHNYGHGGSGVLLSWGCADEVLKLCS